MKKTFVVIILVVLLASMLTAAAPRKLQTLQGTLHWSHANICGVSDYVPTEVMTDVHLTGNFSPTNGINQGCRIVATGYFYSTGQCTYFSVDQYQLTCMMKSSMGSTR
jgi:hypothetical protein